MTDAQIRYRRLTKDDITPQLIGDINDLLPQLSDSALPITEEHLERVFESGTIMFGAFDGKHLVGVTLLVLMFILVGVKAWIEDVVVRNEYRGNGIGSTLMGMAGTTAREAGAKSINLTSKPTRIKARQLYESLGYVLQETGVFRKTF